MILFDLRLTMKRASSGKLKRRFEDTVQKPIEDIEQLWVGAQTVLLYKPLKTYQRKFGWETSELRSFENTPPPPPPPPPPVMVEVTFQLLGRRNMNVVVPLCLASKRLLRALRWTTNMYVIVAMPLFASQRLLHARTFHVWRCAAL